MKQVSNTISMLVILASILTGCYSSVKSMSETKQLTFQVINK